MKRYQDSDKERQLVQAMMNIRLRCRIEYNTLLQWLADSRREQQDTNDELSGDDLLRGQGASVTIRDIINELESAPQSQSALIASGSDD